MTLKERFEAIFSGKIPDKMLWAGDLTYYHASHQEIGDLPLEWHGEAGRDRMHRELNIGEYIPGARAYTVHEGEKVSVELLRNGDEQHRLFHTPLGTLREESVYSRTSFSWGIVKHAVQEISDLKIVRYIMENRSYDATPSAAKKVEADYGDFGIPVLAVPGTPITELNKTWAGVMDLCYMLIDDRAEVEKTLQAIAESQREIWKLTANDPCKYIMICENLSGDTMGGYFDEYMQDYLTENIDIQHGYGKKLMIHIDGALRGALDKIAVTNVDAVDSVTPFPVGDVALADLRSMCGEKMILLGGVPGAMFAPPFDLPTVKKHVLELIRLHKESGKFIIASADQVPPNGDLEIVRMIADIVEEHGGYN